MTTTESDSDVVFKANLSKLTLDQQRAIGKRFVESVIGLADSQKVRKAIDALNASASSADDISEGYRLAKAAAVESYTLCGVEADWLKQASHFVAAAASACLSPEDQSTACKDLAWATAMNARMAKTCENISRGVENDHSEAQRQYELLQAFLR